MSMNQTSTIPQIVYDSDVINIIFNNCKICGLVLKHDLAVGILFNSTQQRINVQATTTTAIRWHNFPGENCSTFLPVFVKGNRQINTVEQNIAFKAPRSVAAHVQLPPTLE